MLLVTAAHPLQLEPVLPEQALPVLRPVRLPHIVIHQIGVRVVAVSLLAT